MQNKDISAPSSVGVHAILLTYTHMLLQVWQVFYMPCTWAVAVATRSLAQTNYTYLQVPTHQRTVLRACGMYHTCHKASCHETGSAFLKAKDCTTLTLLQVAAA